MCTSVADFSSVFEIGVGVNLALSILNEISNPVISRFDTILALKREVLSAVIKDEDEKKVVASQINIISSQFNDAVDEFEDTKDAYSSWMLICAALSLSLLIYSGFYKDDCSGIIVVVFMISLIFLIPLYCATSVYISMNTIKDRYERLLSGIMKQHF